MCFSMVLTDTPSRAAASAWVRFSKRQSTKAARTLGLGRKTLYRKIEEYGIEEQTE